MGMFDYVEVIDYPLPDGVTRDEWQSKSMDCLMDTYQIRADGTLWRKSGWLRTPDGDEALTERMDWTGELRFYDLDHDTWEWVEMVAVFHDGRVHRVTRVQGRDR